MSAADDFHEAKRQNAIVQDAFASAFESFIERLAEDDTAPNAALHAAREAVRANAERHAAFERSLRAVVERMEGRNAK